jgi:hypothetical protein
MQYLSFRDGPKDQARNLEIPGSLAPLAPRNDGVNYSFGSFVLNS